MHLKNNLLTIAICTFKRNSSLKLCLQSIFKQEILPKKILVIDNDYLKSAHPIYNQFKNKLSIEYYQEPSKNISKARNLAIQKCSTQFLAFIDDDCQLLPNWSQIALNLTKKDQFSFFQGNTQIQNNKNKLISIQQKTYQDWINRPYSLDTKNLILNLKYINKHHISFDPNLPIFEDVDFGLQMKQLHLKGKFTKNLQVKHQEISKLKKLIQKYFFRGEIKYFFNQKWHNYDNFSPNIIPQIKDLVKRKKKLYESILNIVFNLGFVYAKKQKFNPNNNTIFLVNHPDKGANQERLKALSKFLKKQNFNVKVLNSQKLFNLKINHFSGGLISPFYFLAYRITRFLIYKMNLNYLSSQLFYFKIIYLGKLISKTLRKANSQISIIQFSEDITTCLNQNPNKLIYDLPTILSEELKENKNFSKKIVQKINKLENKIFKKNIPTSYHWYSILNFSKKKHKKTKNNFILNWGCYPQKKISKFNQKTKIVHIGNLNSPWVNQKLLTKIQNQNSIDTYSYEKTSKQYKELKSKGYLKSLNKLSQYQFGLITISKDPLRKHGFSAKHLTYISYGLPVFCPEWRQDPLLKPATIYYNENNFQKQFKKYSQKKLWTQKHQAALKLAKKLNWEITLKPILPVIYKIQNETT